jgi:hypothetical protein
MMLGERGCENGYSHAAIHLGAGEILESETGVKVTSVADLLLAYDHIAVLRAAGAWSESRVTHLKGFAAQVTGRKFNPYGLPKIEMRRQENIDTAMQQVEEYFAGTAEPVDSDRKVYFCSELVASVFIEVGIISQSAAMLFRPETFFPMDIAKDKAYGCFVGYIAKSDQYVVRADDWFRSNI